MDARVMSVAKEKSLIKKIHVKPSTELVPDEYEVSSEGKKCVHVFVADQDLIDEYITFLNEIDYVVPDCNIHQMERVTEIEGILKTVADDQEETSLLLVLFWGYSLQDGEFTLEDGSTLPYYKIWTPFLTTSNRSFRDKPKIFFFNAIKSKKLQQTDGLLYTEKISPYEVPNEADLLIVYKHNDDKIESIGFIRELTDHVKEHGRKEDLCSVVSIMDTSYYTRPVIISTLLKKFYIMPNHSRGHHYNFETNHIMTLEELTSIDETLTVAANEKLQGSSSIIKKITKKFSSFRNKSTTDRDPIRQKNKDKAQSVNKNPITESAIRKVSRDIATRPSVERPLRKISSSKVPVKKMSVDKHWIP